MRPYVVERRYIMKSGGYEARRQDCTDPEDALRVYDLYMMLSDTTGVTIYRRIPMGNRTVLDAIKTGTPPVPFTGQIPERRFGIEIFPPVTEKRPPVQQELFI